MTKKQLLDDPNSIWNKATDDTPIFPLVATDELMGRTIKYWLEQSLEHGLHVGKYDSAMQIALDSGDWHLENCKNCKEARNRQQGLRGMLVKLKGSFEDEMMDDEDYMKGAKNH